MKMKDVVQFLGEGWYGNGDKYAAGHRLRKHEVNCRGLWLHCLSDASKKCVHLCGGM